MKIFYYFLLITIPFCSLYTADTLQSSSGYNFTDTSEQPLKDYSRFLGLKIEPDFLENRACVMQLAHSFRSTVADVGRFVGASNDEHKRLFGNSLQTIENWQSVLVTEATDSPSAEDKRPENHSGLLELINNSYARVLSLQAHLRWQEDFDTKRITALATENMVYFVEEGTKSFDVLALDVMSNRRQNIQKVYIPLFDCFTRLLDLQSDFLKGLHGDAASGLPKEIVNSLYRRTLQKQLSKSLDLLYPFANPSWQFCKHDAMNHLDQIHDSLLQGASDLDDADISQRLTNISERLAAMKHDFDSMNGYFQAHARAVQQAAKSLESCLYLDAKLKQSYDPIRESKKAKKLRFSPTVHIRHADVLHYPGKGCDKTQIEWELLPESQVLGYFQRELQRKSDQALDFAAVRSRVLHAEIHLANNAEPIYLNSLLLNSLSKLLDAVRVDMKDLYTGTSLQCSKKLVSAKLVASGRFVPNAVFERLVYILQKLEHLASLLPSTYGPPELEQIFEGTPHVLTLLLQFKLELINIERVRNASLIAADYHVKIATSLWYTFECFYLASVTLRNILHDESIFQQMPLDEQRNLQVAALRDTIRMYTEEISQFIE